MAGWGWAGNVREFLETPYETWLDALVAHQRGLLSRPPSSSQRAAWRDEHRVMVATFKACIAAEPDATAWGVTFEYELPLEGGRRPDVVVLAGGSVVVLEFKSAAGWSQAHLDQVEAYARDLAEYHEASHGRPAHAMLVLPHVTETEQIGRTVVTDRDGLHRYLYAAASDGEIALDEWLTASYVPLPTLVEAARRIFRHEPLPHVKRALALEIPQTVELVGHLIREAAQQGSRVLVFLTGVPGSGKTLVGLRVVYEGSEDFDEQAAFLSGNGPLVTVLQDALGSRVFVKDLHGYIRTYGINGRQPKERILVFDEAQRAWDRNHMFAKRGVERSEPELLVEIGERVPEWSALVGLVGHGQEIHVGEEGGMAQWAHAAQPPHAARHWHVHCPPKLTSVFTDLDVTAHERLDLTMSLRSRRAERLHSWVDLVVERGDLLAANRLAEQIQHESYPMYLTRDLDEARTYVRARYEGEPDRRYGLLASSHAKCFVPLGVDNSFMAASRMNVAKWYNAPASDERSCCRLDQPVREFNCQGLELDLPVLCWGEDLRWTETGWSLQPVRRRPPLRDPEQILRNTYRVLLTRGRDGLVIWVPPIPELDATVTALLAAGVRPLPQPVEVAA